MAEISAITKDTPLETITSVSLVSSLLSDYNPASHTEHQPETPVAGVKRLIRWTLSQMSDKGKIKNIAGFLRNAAKKGMNKPTSVLEYEQDKEYREQELRRQLKRRHETKRLERERELFVIPPDLKAEIDRICLG